MNINKKALSILLSLALAVTLLSVPVFASPENSVEDPALVDATIDTDVDTVSEDSSAGETDISDQEETAGTEESADTETTDDPVEDPADAEEPGTGIEAEDSGWIAVLEKPANNDVEAVEAVVYRKGGRDGEIKVLESDLSELTEEDFEDIKSGNLEIWNGWKYKKASQKITSAIDDSETAEGDYELKYGSAPFALDAASEVKDLSYTTSDKEVVTVTEDGEIAPAGIGSAVITITASDNEYYKTTVRKINVKVVKGDQIITAENEEYKVAIGTADFPINAESNADDAEKLTYKAEEQTSLSIDEETGIVSLSDITSSPVEITIAAPETEHYEAVQKTVTVTVTKPSTPKLTVAAIGGKKIKLTWTDSWTSPALPRDTSKVSYEVYCPQFAKKLRSGKTTNTYITSKKLKKNKKYKCRVRAIVTVGTKKYTTAWTSYVTSPKVK